MLEQPQWRSFKGKRVIIHAAEGTDAARIAPQELEKAEQAVEALEKLLQAPASRQGEPVQIYLVDSTKAVPVTSEAITQTIGPAPAGETLILSLTRFLVGRWFGEAAASADLFVSGLAGVVAARSGNGPTVEEASEAVRAALKAKKPVSIFQPVAETEPQAASATKAKSGLNFVATSFVAYLIEVSGAKALAEFLKVYDPQRRDRAAVSAFHQPLGELEEDWLNKVQRVGKHSSAFRAFLRQLGPYLKPYWLREVEVLFYMLIGLSYTLILPLSTRYLVDEIIPKRNLGALGGFVIFLVICYLLNALVGVRRAYVNNWINERILIELQERMFNHLQQLSHNFHTKAKVGDIMSRFSRDLQAVGRAMAQVVGVGVYMSLNVVVAAITIIILSPMLGALIVLVVPLFALCYLLLRSRLEQASRKEAELAAEAANVVQENLLAHPLIKAFGLEQQTSQAFHNRLLNLFKAGLRLVVMGSLFETSVTLAIAMGQIVVLGVGGFLVIEGNFTVGTLLAFISLLPTLFGPVASLSNVGQSVQMASGSLQRISELLDEPVAVADKPGAKNLPPLSHQIRLEQVSFSYDTQRNVLHRLDLTIPVGQHVSIVGPSGSGKSTLVNLLLRFWDTTGGRLRFDEHDVREVRLASLRSQIGVVFQDTFVFDTTLRENIAVGRPGASDAEIVAAAKAANLESYVASLPAGFDTVLGERGVRMSGGQRQRLGIARALLRNPRLLILDEATSALDAQTASEILETLQTLMPGRTTISITHRLNVAATADWIIVLEEGRVVEQGTHSQLVKAGGLYQRLYEAQE